MEANCELCGKKLNRAPKHIKRVKAIYCSRECRGLAQQKFTTFKCEACGSDFVRRNKDAIKGRRFCSFKCSGLGRRTRKTRECGWCKKQIEVVPANIRKVNFCSVPCKNEFHRKAMAREGNPRWEGGIAKEEYPIEWCPALKKRIRMRDKFTCVKCGKKGLDVHHIDKDKTNNKEENLITLCHKCHMEFHSKDRKHAKYQPGEWVEIFWGWVGMHFEKVTAAKTEKKDHKIYSIEVEKNHNFVANNFLTHNTIIVDETDEIDDESYAKVYRMLLESETSQLIEIGNPWKLGHFYEHHNSDDWVKIHIPATACVAAGRMTAEAIEDQRANLTELEAQVLLDAEFPDEIEMAVFSKEAIAKCSEPATSKDYDKILIGVDVARGGRDRTVITVGGVIGRQVHYLTHREMDTRDIMNVAGATALLAEDFEEHYGKGKIRIGVDCVGNGAGVHDRLKELNYRTFEFMAGNRAMDARYYNIKTEAAFRFHEMMKADNMKNVPGASKFTLQLRAWTYEVRSDRQLKIVDPEEKSPDYGDSLLIMAFLEIYHGMTEARVPTRGL